MFTSVTSPFSTTSLLRRLLPVMVVVFLGLMSMGIPLSVLPLHLHQTIGCDNFTVGWVMGAESVATLLCRRFAGSMCDGRGPKAAMLLGLAASAGSGLAYLLSVGLASSSRAALVWLVLGRVAMGVGEGLIFTSGGVWPIGLLGREHVGKTMAWIGVAMFGGIAAGTALGAALYATAGFAAAAAAAMAAPVLGAVVAWRAVAPRMPSKDAAAWPFWRVLVTIWRPGCAFALATVGYAAIASFLVLAYAERGWAGGGWALSAFCGSFVMARFVFGHHADRGQSAWPIVATLALEAVGLCLLALAGTPWLALAGAALSGFGLSMVYPLLAVPAVGSVPPTQLGAAVAAYDVCFDASILLATPLCGALAGFGFQTLFALAAVAVAAAIPLAIAACRAAPAARGA